MSPERFATYVSERSVEFIDIVPVWGARYQIGSGLGPNEHAGDTFRISEA